MGLIREYVGKIIGFGMIVIVVSMFIGGGVNAGGARTAVDNSILYGSAVGIVLKGVVEGGSAVVDGWNLVPSTPNPAAPTTP